jgi:hypothetical protein
LEQCREKKQDKIAKQNGGQIIAEQNGESKYRREKQHGNMAEYNQLTNPCRMVSHNVDGRSPPPPDKAY